MLVEAGSNPVSSRGQRQTLGLDPEVSEEMEKHYPFVKWCFTVLSEKSGEVGLKADLMVVKLLLRGK